jgi:hypothetical protein
MFPKAQKQDDLTRQQPWRYCAGEATRLNRRRHPHEAASGSLRALASIKERTCSVQGSAYTVELFVTMSFRTAAVLRKSAES